jgi:hypothetical protein
LAKRGGKCKAECLELADCLLASSCASVHGSDGQRSGRGLRARQHVPHYTQRWMTYEDG